MMLVDPFGRIIDKEFATGSPDVDYDSYLNSVVYRVKNPDAGEWIVKLVGVDVPYYGEPYTIVVNARTSINLVVATDKEQYHLGEPIKIMGLITAENNPDFMLAIANITDPYGHQHTILLYDDGGHDDMEKSDLTFSGYFNDTHIPGSYTIEVEILAGINGLVVTRSYTKSVYVSSSEYEMNFIINIKKHEEGNRVNGIIEITTLSKSLSASLSSLELTGPDGYKISGDQIKLDTNHIRMPAYSTSYIHFTIYLPENAPEGRYDVTIYIRSNNTYRYHAQLPLSPISIIINKYEIDMNASPTDHFVESLTVNVKGYGETSLTDYQIVGNITSFIKRLEIGGTVVSSSKPLSIIIECHIPESAMPGLYLGILYLSFKNIGQKTVLMRLNITNRRETAVTPIISTTTTSFAPISTTNHPITPTNVETSTVANTTPNTGPSSIYWMVNNLRDLLIIVGIALLYTLAIFLVIKLK